MLSSFCNFLGMQIIVSPPGIGIMFTFQTVLVFKRLQIALTPVLRTKLSSKHRHQQKLYSLQAREVCSLVEKGSNFVSTDLHDAEITGMCFQDSLLCPSNCLSIYSFPRHPFLSRATKINPAVSGLRILFFYA